MTIASRQAINVYRYTDAKGRESEFEITTDAVTGKFSVADAGTWPTLAAALHECREKAGCPVPRDKDARFVDDPAEKPKRKKKPAEN
jgi:hypothetical protein